MGYIKDNPHFSTGPDTVVAILPYGDLWFCGITIYDGKLPTCRNRGDVNFLRDYNWVEALAISD